MIASVHIADVGGRSALAIVRRAPKPAEVSGLRHANIGLSAPLSESMLAKPDPGRVGLIFGRVCSQPSDRGAHIVQLRRPAPARCMPIIDRDHQVTARREICREASIV